MAFFVEVHIVSFTLSIQRQRTSEYGQKFEIFGDEAYGVDHYQSVPLCGYCVALIMNLAIWNVKEQPKPSR